MSRRRVFVACAVAAAGFALAGCNLGLDPFPEPVHPGGTSSLGLNPFPREKGQTEPTLGPSGPRYRDAMLDAPADDVKDASK